MQQKCKKPAGGRTPAPAAAAVYETPARHNKEIRFLNELEKEQHLSNAAR